MTVFIWRVKVEVEYTKGISDAPTYNVTAKDLGAALRKVAKLVPKSEYDTVSGDTYKLKNYQVIFADRLDMVDA